MTGPPGTDPSTGEVRELLLALSEANNDLADLHRTLAKEQATLAATTERQRLTLSMVAHDLRNPLGIVIGFSEVLQRNLSDRVEEPERLLLERIEAQGRRMLRLVEDLVDSAVIERGVTTLDLADVEVGPLLQRVAETHVAAAQSKGIRVEVELPEPPVTARLDPSRIEQVLDNLLVNAVKFTPRDSGRSVSVRAAVRGGQVLIEVEDEGIGIEDDDLDHLFDPFTPGQRTGTDGEPGTGLGLAITRSLAQAHDGSVTIESRAGGGTCVSVWLPLDGPSAGR